MRVGTLVSVRLTMLVYTGCLEPLTVEEDGVAFEDTACLRLVLNRHYLESQHDDGVTTVSSNQGVVVRALLGQYGVAELVELAFTDGSNHCFRCVCNRQHGHLQTDSCQLTFCVHYGVTVDTGLVDGHELSRVARQCPDVRQCVRADRNAIVEETNDIQVQLNDTITTIRRGESSRVDTGCRVNLVLEVNGVAIVDGALNDVEVLTQYIEVQDHDTITTDAVLDRVAVFTGILEVQTIEVIRIAFADVTIDRGVARLSNNQLEAVEHTLTVEIGGVVAVKALGVQLNDRTGPLVDPLVRQLGRADSNHGVNQRVNEELEDRGAITTILVLTIVRVYARSIKGVTEEDELIALDDVLGACTVVRFVHRQDECLDAVTAVRCGEGVAVDTRFCYRLAAEQVRTSTTDRYLNGIEDLLNGAEVDSEEELLSVDSGIVTIGTSGVEEFLFTAPAVGPVVREIVLADSDDGVD